MFLPRIHPQGAPQIILIFGPSGAGKSTLARRLAAKLPRCAHIEVDALRYMVAGGLVAWSGGTSPALEPDEYARQCGLGMANAALLAGNFFAHGFSSVIEGLEDECRPGREWAARVLPNIPCRSIVVLCNEDVLRQRLEERGWKITPDKLAELAWYRANAALFDFTVDTTSTAPDAAVEALLSKLDSKHTC